ncbi:adenylate/guanylate cyclase domain-containing protein [bacterium]|nr:adenylate/guanylate cyclase domain-containing protein [bacterium]
MYRLGIPVEWVEEPFEWSRPQGFSVSRQYSKGPVKEMRVVVRLDPDPGTGGTLLSYKVWAIPANPLGLIAIPIQIGLISHKQFGDVFHRYDKAAGESLLANTPPDKPVYAPGGKPRLDLLCEKLVQQDVDSRLVEKLKQHIQRTEDLALSRIQPYVLTDAWGASRRELLDLCLKAVRVGLLEFQWDLLCPLCRGAKESFDHLKEIEPTVHCDVCNIDFTANFERSVELTFRPTPSIRPVAREAFCVSGPQVTPHIHVQQLMAPSETRTIHTNLEPGNYRLRALDRPGGLYLRATSEGRSEVICMYKQMGWAEEDEELDLATEVTLTFENQSDREELFVLERMAWSDMAVTAAEVTVLQLFRDLFSSEALRPGEKISVGSLTIVFTDLKASTQLYRTVGDAPAFGRVMDHFDIVKAEIAKEDGSVVKTIGDAVMASFRTPDAALRAMLKAQTALFDATNTEGAPLLLKVGMHQGPCIAVTLNERLDYFGTSVNLAARLVDFSNGSDLILSNAIYTDPEVQDYLHDPEHRCSTERVETNFKGFEGEQFEVWKICHSLSEAPPAQS